MAVTKQKYICEWNFYFHFKTLFGFSLTLTSSLGSGGGIVSDPIGLADITVIIGL